MLQHSPQSLVPRIARLSPKKRALLALQLDERLGTTSVSSASSGAQQLVAYVVPSVRPHEAASDGTPETSVNADLVSQWKLVYDAVYSLSEVGSDPTFNIAGWNSSYTGDPIPAEEMQEQVDCAVHRILRFQPSRVLEIGCGTGLLLFRIAPHCAHYCASDISSAALEHVETLSGRFGLSQVRLFQAAADDWSAVPQEAFDAIILNSVIQYFPSVEYLLRVLEGALERLAPGGVVFIGDVRSLPLLEAFATSIELHDAPATLTVDRLRERVRKRLTFERELVIDPEFFQTLRRHLPRIAQVESEPKGGRYLNELNCFRYDVTLLTQARAAMTGNGVVLDWEADDLDLAVLPRLLREGEPQLLEVRDIPDARVQRDLKVVELLAGEQCPRTVGEVRKTLRLLPTAGVDVETLCDAASGLPYDVHVRLSSRGLRARNDAIFTRRGVNAEKTFFPGARIDKDSRPLRPWSQYANTPLHATRVRQQMPALRSFLQARLPDHMVPAIFMVLDALPLTPSGKLDRRALPSPDHDRPELAATYQAPRTPIERRLAEIWEGLLGLGRVGVHDNFFNDLGGHSLLATQLVSRIRDAFQIDLPLRQIFDAPTVALLAAAIADRSKQAVPAAGIRPARAVPIDVDGLSDAEVDALLEGLIHDDQTLG